MPLDASAILDGLEDRTAVWANVDKGDAENPTTYPMNTPLPQRQDGDILTTLIYRDKDKTLCQDIMQSSPPYRKDQT